MERMYVEQIEEALKEKDSNRTDLYEDLSEIDSSLTHLKSLTMFSTEETEGEIEGDLKRGFETPLRRESLFEKKED